MMPESELLLDASGLVKAYHGRRVVNKANVTVKRGEVVGLLGPNGAGFKNKTEVSPIL